MKKRDKNGKFIRTVPDKQCLVCQIKFYSPNIKRKYCSKYCYYEMKKMRKDRVNWTKEMRERSSLAKLGSKNPQWKGGITKGRIKQINTIKYKEWRRQVFERDDYTCLSCKRRNGNGKKVILNADHVVPWWKDKNKRFDINNGQTLCYQCHLKKTKEEMTESWVNQYSCGKVYKI